MFAELDELIAREVERSRVTGLAVALVRGGEIVWSKGYGYAALESQRAMTPTTVCSIQSVTKPMVATAVMQHVERGRIGLDEPVNRHLTPLRIESAWEAEQPVTLRHLLTHTSGLAADGALGPSDRSKKIPLATFIAQQAKTVRPPGAEMEYANIGYDIIGALVARYGEMPYGEYLRRHLFEPLGMQSSSIIPPDDIAAGYYLSAVDGEHYARAAVDWPTDPPRPCGSVNSTVEDMARFLIAHINSGSYQGRRILGNATVDDMQRLHAQCGPRASGMGLGFRVDEVAGQRLVCHGGDGVTFTAFAGMLPEESLGVAMLINMGRAQTTRAVVAHSALEVLLGRRPSLLDDAPAAGLPEGWDALRGRYGSSFWGIEATLQELDGAFVLDVEGGIVGGGPVTRSRLDFSDDGVARPHDGPFHGFELAFVPGEGDQPAHLYGGLYPFTFVWQAPLEEEPAIDESAELGGGWTGAVVSPLGAVPVTLNIGEGRGTISVLSAQNEAVQEYRRERGRVSGHVDVSVPGLGDFRVFLRLHAASERLLGQVYACGDFGEVPMRASLGRDE